MSLKQNKINPDAIAWLETFSEELDADPDIIDVMPIENVREELRRMGADVGFHAEMKKTLEKQVSLSDRLITWISELWEPLWAGQLVTADDIPEQEHSFATETEGEIKIVCDWESQDDDTPAHIHLSWEADITTDSEIWVRFVNPETQELFYEECLGTELSDDATFKADELGFDPSKERWAISVMLKERE